MSNTISGGISFSGIGSGTDFAAMIEQLKEVEALKLDSLDDSRTKASDGYDAMTELIDIVREVSESLSELNSPSKFLTKLASSSNESVLSAKADANAVDGTHTIDIKQLASNAIWANKNEFDSKTTIVNDSGGPLDFSYTYKGTTRTLSVPANTTLESFVNMVNEDKANPGIKMSIIQTANGYTFQASGKDSGKDASLTIHPSDLKGMSGAGSIWTAGGATDSNAFNANEPSAGEYEYKLRLQDGKEFSFSLSGQATQAELVSAINSAYKSSPGVDPSAPDIATTDSDDKLTIQGLAYMDRTHTVDGATQSPQTVYDNKPTITTTVAGDLQDDILGEADVPTDYSFTDYRGKEVTFSISGKHSHADVLTELEALGYPSTASVSEDKTTTTIETKGLTDVSALGGGNPSAVWPADIPIKTDPDAPINENILPENISFTLIMGTGEEKIVTVPKGSSMQDVYNALGSDVYSEVDGVAVLKNVSSITSDPPGLAPAGGVTESDAWAVQKSQDAEFYIDNWPQKLTSSSNEVKGVLEGVTLTLKDEEKVQITVASDTESVKANIQTYLDGINGIIKKVQDLTAITTTPSDSYTEDGVGKSDAGPLSGNYSINLFSSRFKSGITDNPPGFQPMTGEDIFSGDFVASLAQMGIKNNPDTGLFEIAPHGMTEEIQALDQELFDNAMEENLEDVIAFFANDGVGKSSSPNFRYSNHIDGMTQYGTYDVSYSVDADGKANVMIDGKVAYESDLYPNTYTVDNGDSAGLSIVIDNLAEGNYSGTVSIQQGKVGQLEDFLNAELHFVEPEEDDASIGEKNGGLMIAQDGYKNLIESLDGQITKEIERLERWEETQRMQFARLDTLLGSYNQKMEQLNSQLAQLG